MKFRLLTAAALGTILSFSASAAPINVVEAVDFSNDPFAPTDLGVTLPLDIGTNFISGSIGQDDADAWITGIVAGAMIADIRVVISNMDLMGGTGGGATVNAHLHTDAIGFAADGTYSLVPIGFFPVGNVFLMSSQAGLAEFDYVWEIEVIGDSSGVPEPGSIAMLGLGLLGLATLRRRRAA